MSVSMLKMGLFRFIILFLDISTKSETKMNLLTVILSNRFIQSVMQ